MRNIKCKVTMFTYDRFEGEDAPKDCVKMIDDIENHYRMVSLTDEQYDFLMKKTDVETAEYGLCARPDFEGLRDDFTEIHNRIANPLLEKIRCMLEEDGSAQIWIDEAMRRIAVSVHQACFDDEEGDLFHSNEPIYVKHGMIYNQKFGQPHVVSFVDGDEKFNPSKRK